MYTLTPTHGFWVGFVFTINSIIGAGILPIPWAFSEGGIVLGILLQVIAGLLALILGFQMLEIMSRAEAFARKKEGVDKHIALGPYDEIQPLQSFGSAPSISERKFDMTEMFNMFCGEKVRKWYLTLFVISIYAGSVAYCTIFAITFTEFVPIFGYECDIYAEGLEGGCKATYMFYLLVFCALMIYFCYRGYEEQVTMQVTLASLRFVVIGVILLTVIGETAFEKAEGEPIKSSPRMWKPELTGIVFPILFLSISFHNTIPNTSQLIMKKSANLSRVIFWAVLTCSVTFILVGVFVPLAIANVSKISSLEWKEYSAGHDPSSRPWWVYAIIVTVVVFPAVDVISIFPIYTIALSDNLIAMRYGYTYEGKITKVMSQCSLSSCSTAVWPSSLRSSSRWSHTISYVPLRALSWTSQGYSCS